MQHEEVTELADFESELGISFTKLEKADAQSIEESNGLLWAKKIFKTKPNHTVSNAFKEKIHTVFHHLTKEELIEKVLANYLAQQGTSTNPKTENLRKKSSAKK